MSNLSKMHSFSYNSQSLLFKGSKIEIFATGFVAIFRSHIFIVRKSRVNTYRPFLEKQPSDIDATMSVKKFLEDASTYSSKIIPELSQIPLFLISQIFVTP